LVLKILDYLCVGYNLFPSVDQDLVFTLVIASLWVIPGACLLCCVPGLVMLFFNTEPSEVELAGDTARAAAAANPGMQEQMIQQQQP